MPVHYLTLLVAVASEIIATSALAASQQFTRIGPSILVVIGYAASFYFLSLTLKVMPVGIVYAIWSGLGVIGISVIGLIFLGQRLDLPAVFGMALIVAGVLVIHLFSRSSGH
ncbi:DMT family transporter [Qingshengfaniella alkalisoli]|uniref:QacE family quaternary ammonium compound efflux SMR transporter n=1 Tax=Qingshengfaniella alkalisoli TaxID=2599296 RepID=A0A5B8IWL6_9RHOB|nr:SMR family transporter [Qingshengfaniella alkalisoli]QDY69231.1 QacE family quaternary ammonium compound efflux SMR transporter [Qingshengfaniella alkalisoli]